MILSDIIAKFPVVARILGTIGSPYWYGRGTPASPFESIRSGSDCSGFLQICMVLLGLIPSTLKDRGAAQLADDSVQVKEPRLGDFAYYPGHVMLCLGGQWVIGATGGDKTTLGNDPKACVQIKRFDYRPDFVCFCRLKTAV